MHACDNLLDRWRLRKCVLAKLLELADGHTSARGYAHCAARHPRRTSAQLRKRGAPDQLRRTETLVRAVGCVLGCPDLLRRAVLRTAQRRELANQELDVLFPGFSSHNQQQIFCGWPTERYTRCGYSAPSLGQVTRVFPRLQGGLQEKLFFAGEYTSPGFNGYMEGGLNSGAVLAGRLSRQFNLLGVR